MNTQDFHNWCKLEFLTARGSGLIRNEFKKRWHNKYKKIWDSSCAAEFCNGIGLRVYEEAYKDQQKLLKQGDVDKWDLTLLRSIFDTSIFGKKQEIKDFNAKVRKLADIRNTLAHHSSKNISNTDFDLYWEKVSNILVDMGDSKDELDELKCSLKSQQIIHIRNENIQKANQLKLEGNKHFSAKEYSKAISSYTEAIVLPGIPEHDLAVLYSNRSASYLERHLHNKTDSEDIKSARKDAKNSKNLNPEWYKAYLRLGRAYEALNKLDKAVKAFHKALILEPNNEELKNAHSNAIRNKGAQDRYEHLDSGMNGISTEQVLQDFQVRTGQNMKLEDLDKLNKFAKSLNPVLEDVWKGHQYRDGDNGVKQDYAMAAKYYGLAVNKNNAEAMYNLAMLHQRGLGVKQDYGIAFSLLQRATEQPAIDPFFNGPTVGVAEAEHSLGNHYLEGIYVKKDELVAASWFERAIEHGYGRSANNLGLMYMKGQGVPQDLKRAEQLFLFAASHEDKNALDNLVVLYCELENPEKALEWNKKAIEKGSMVARSMQRELESMLPQFKKDLDKSGVVEWEKANNLCPDNLSVKERIERRLAFENPQAKTLVENVQRIQAQMMTPKTGVTTSKKMFKYDITELEMYSHKSVIAKKMHEAMSYFSFIFRPLNEHIRKY